MKAYFDESGKHQQAPIISIFGLLMSVDTCKELQRRWFREAARAPKIPLPFHMSDCVVGSKEFAYLKGDEEARLSMQERMIRTLRGLDAQAYGVGVIREDYAPKADVIERASEFRNPWFLAFEGAISEMMLSSAEAGKKHTVSAVFDRQDEFRDRAFELYQDILTAPVSYRDRLGTLSFSPKDKVAPLQAVDIVTYEATRYLKECRLGGAEERWQSALLRQMIKVKGKILDAKGIQLIADGINEAAQRKAQISPKPADWVSLTGYSVALTLLSPYL